MAAGLVIYSIGRKNLPPEGNLVPNPLPAAGRRRMAVVAAAVVVLVAVLALTGVLTADRLASTVVIVTVIAAVSYFVVILGGNEVTPVERRRVIAFIPLFLVLAVFWSLYQQQFTVVAEYADKQLNREIFGWEMPPGVVNSINPVFVMILSLVFAAIWTKLGDRAPSSPIKFALATVVMGVAFLLFIPMASTVPNSAPLMGMVGILFVFTVAELLISPVSLSLATRLAPAKFTTQMVGLLFLASALGTAMAGVLAGRYDDEDQIAYFGSIGGVAVVVGVVLALFAKPISRLMSGVK